MKKLLLALLSMSAIACADVRVNFRLLNNGVEMGAGEMILSDEQLKNGRMDEFPSLADANPEDCCNGLCMVSVGDCNNECITLNCMLALKRNEVLEVLAKPQMVMTWNEVGTVEIADNEGNMWTWIMVAEQI